MGKRLKFHAVAAGWMAVMFLLGGAVTYAPKVSLAEEIFMQGAVTPLITPTPQSVQVTGPGFSLPRSVDLVIGDGADPATVSKLLSFLRTAGSKNIKTFYSLSKKPSAAVTVWLGNPNKHKAAATVFTTEESRIWEKIAPDGYVLAAFNGKAGKNIVLAGGNADGTFYAFQSLRRLITKKHGGAWMPEVIVNDYPKMPVRGIIEGFYGKPWTYEDRLSMIDFMGEHKLNTYVYAPKNDPYHRDKWREPYPAAEREKLGHLVDAAKVQHVDFVFTISPGLDVCYSADKDYRALARKAQSMWDLGVRSFAILLDDISLEMNCQQDRVKFGHYESSTAAAQAHLLNRFLHEFIQKHLGATPLITVPTEYYQSGTSPYRKQFAASVDPSILVYWTGFNITPGKITSAEADEISSIFKHKLLVWDNYPVTDYIPERVLLGPLEGREKDLTGHHVIGLTANPMEHSEASKIALYTVADYTWNPDAYDSSFSWNNSLKEFGGEAEPALRTFAENNYSSVLHAGESAVLQELIQRFWNAFETGDAKSPSLALQAGFLALEQLPEALKQLKNKNFLAEMDPWILKLHHYGKAGRLAVEMLNAMAADDHTLAGQKKTALSDEMISDTVDVIVPKSRSSNKMLDGFNRDRNSGELIRFTPEFGARTGTNEWGYEITIVDGKVAQVGGNNNLIPKNGYVLSIHGDKWLQEHAIVGADVSIKDSVVTLAVKKGVYPVPNKKVAAQGVVDSFLLKAIQTYEFWANRRDIAEPLTTMGTWDVYAPQNMIDGDDRTFYWSSAAPGIGDYVGVSLGKPKAIKQIKLRMGNEGSRDYIHNGVMEISSDGLSWEQIGTYIEQPEIKIDFPEGTTARYVRFKAIAAQTEWIQVREWTIVEAPSSTPQ